MPGVAGLLRRTGGGRRRRGFNAEAATQETGRGEKSGQRVEISSQRSAIGGGKIVKIIKVIKIIVHI